MRALLSIALVLLLWAGGLSVCAETLDDDPEVVSSYARGERFMRQGDWLEASRLFLELMGRFPNSPNQDLFIFNRAKAEMYLGDFSEAQAGFTHFIERFPNQPNVPHAHFYLGNVMYLRGSLDRAMTEYITAYGLSNDSRLSSLCVNSLREAFRTAASVSLTSADLSSMPKDKACALVDQLTDVLTERKSFASLKSLNEYCGRSYAMPSGPQSGDYRSGNLEIALVLPLSGEFQTFGEEIYRGAVIAADEYRTQTGGKLTLTPYDGKGDPVATARILKELVNSTTDAVIGPLTSEAASVGSAVLSCGVLPMVAPAATQAGLTMLSESSFQLSPNIELQGVRMAEYAIRELQADSAAIITPTGVDELTMSRAFERRFKELGGTIVGIEYYRPRDKDFGKQIRDLKSHLIGIDPESAYFIAQTGDTLDPDGIPVYINCLYLPGDPSQLRQLLPQIGFYNVNAAYLGSDGWGDEEVYRLGDAVTRQAVFPSPFLTRRSSETFVRFSAAYDRRYGERPQRLASLGYDALRVITEAVKAGAGNRDALVEQLSAVQNFVGAAGRVSFGEHRENIELPVYRIVSGAPMPLNGEPTDYVPEAPADTTNQPTSEPGMEQPDDEEDEAQG